MVAALRQYALRTALLDHPNERSSHSVPTPRGGGAAIVIVMLAYGAYAGLSGALPGRFAIAVLPPSALVAFIGWLDDRGHVSAAIRALVHFVAAIWAVYWLGGLSTLRVGDSPMSLGVAGDVLAVIGIVAATNFFNFMDGSDGIAGVETVLVCAFGAAACVLSHADDLAMIAAVLAACAFGFLLWNWQPAKIFMGDVGSGFLGFFIACLALRSEHGGAPALVWLLLLGAFVTDPLITLVRRMLRGEKWYTAHRSHAYQRMIQSGWSHARVATSVAVIDVLLGGAALVATHSPRMLLPVLGTSFLALIGCYLAIERRRRM